MCNINIGVRQADPEAEDNVTGIHPSLSLYLGWIPCEHYLEQPRLDSQVAHAPPTFLLPFGPDHKYRIIKGKSIGPKVKEILTLWLFINYYWTKKCSPGPVMLSFIFILLGAPGVSFLYLSMEWAPKKIMKAVTGLSNPHFLSQLWAHFILESSSCGPKLKR